MKRWKLLILIGLGLLLLGASLPPYVSRADNLTTHTIPVDSAGDSTYFWDTVLFKVAGFNYLSYRLTFTPTSDSILGAWVEDSIFIGLEVLRRGVWLHWDSAIIADFSGDTLEGVILPADGDTLLNEYARFVIYFADTVSDTTSEMVYAKTIDLFGAKR